LVVVKESSPVVWKLATWTSVCQGVVAGKEVIYKPLEAWTGIVCYKASAEGQPIQSGIVGGAAAMKELFSGLPLEKQQATHSSVMLKTKDL
jgi:hypothetical protein